MSAVDGSFMFRNASTAAHASKTAFRGFLTGPVVSESACGRAFRLDIVCTSGQYIYIEEFLFGLGLFVSGIMTIEDCVRYLTLTTFVIMATSIISILFSYIRHYYFNIMSKKRSRDLNKQIDDEERKRQKVHQRGKRKVSILFDGRGIQNAVVRNIKHEDTAYVVGCVAWLSNKRILKAMADHLKGVTIITTTDKLTKRRKNQQAYAKLSGCFAGGVIRTVGEGRGRFKSLMHHKFLIFLNAAREPIGCMNGSFNVTESAVTNLENVMIFDDPEIATTFFEEFKRIHRISRPLKIKA